jgi:hypothetical protein
MASKLGRGSSNSLRLVFSGLIVSSSVLGFWWLLESSKVTETYLITKTDLASGSPVSTDNLQPIELSLFSLSKSYLRANELPVGSYLIRPLSAGEAVPKAALTTQQLDDRANIVITPSVELSSEIRPGTKVSIWASPMLDYQNFGEPSIQAIDVEVVGISEPQGNFTQGLNSVELRVPIESIQSLLRAIANNDAIALTSSSSSLAD